MIRIQGRPHTACDGFSRRTLLEAAGAGLFGLSVPRLLQAESIRPGPTAPRARAKSVIFVFLFGGPSQLETFDLKPDATEKIRGPFRPIACRTPGLLISEHLPKLAAISDRFAIVRTMSHKYNDHSGAAHYIQTGKIWHIPVGGGFSNTPQDWPSMGSVVEYLRQRNPGDSQLPAYAVMPNSLGRLQDMGQYRRPGEYAGWLGQRFNPLTTKIDKRDDKDNPYWRDCRDDELTFTPDGLAGDLAIDRARSRISLLQQFDNQRRHLDTDRRVLDFDRFRQRALGLATAPQVRQALDVRREAPQVRDRYGRHLFGQSLLMARRLVESGVRYVTVHYDACDGYGWDSHLTSDDVRDHLMPTFDQGLAALLSDLDGRGLLDETLVVALGEMGRTPLATPQWGRQHWSTLFPALLAGAGVRSGLLLGRSDKDAAYAIDTPYGPEQLAATIYQALGIDPTMTVNDPLGRPVSIVAPGAEPILELFG